MAAPTQVKFKVTHLHFTLMVSTVYCIAHFISLHILLFILFYYLFLFSFSPIFIYSLVLCFIVLFLFYFLHFPLSGPVLTYISLLIIPCMIVYVTNNKEPWTFTVVPYWHYSLYVDSPKKCIVKSSQIYYPIEDIWIAGRVGRLAIPTTKRQSRLAKVNHLSWDITNVNSKRNCMPLCKPYTRFYLVCSNAVNTQTKTVWGKEKDIGSQDKWEKLVKRQLQKSIDKNTMSWHMHRPTEVKSLRRRSKV